MQRLGNFIKDTRGAAFIEAALIMPVILLLTLGGLAVGQTFVTYHLIDESLRGATRYLARVPANAVETWELTKARNLAGGARRSMLVAVVKST